MSLLMMLLGATVGMIGTLVGAGGGFLAVPLLVILFGTSPTTVAGTSLIMVAVNSMVGSAAYWRQGRVDLRTALLLTAASVPGTWLGAFLGPLIPAQQFRLGFALILLILAAWTAWKALRPPAFAEAASGLQAVPAPWSLHRVINLRDGTSYSYTIAIPRALGFAFIVGVLGAIFGIGGGPILMPLLLYGLYMPVAVATATSQLTVAITSLWGAAIYIAGGHADIGQAVWLSLGTLAGAPAGAWLSQRIGSKWIVLTLSCLLALLAVRLVL